MAGTPDLFVVCKSCGSEVSPYITECPYCGQRLRKRAPKIEREGGEARVKETRKLPRPTLGPLRTGEIPGIRGDELRRPYATIVLTILGIAGFLLLFLVERVSIAVNGPIHGDWWRLVASPFLYENSWAQLAAVTAIALYGWLLERRHGPVLVVVLFALCGVGGTAAAVALQQNPIVLGGNGAALGLLAAWAIPLILARRRGQDDEADLLGTAVIAAVVLLLPLVSDFTSVVAGLTGALAGVLAGLILARLKPR
ncbi:MAG: rhomboid family intrarane serine protease [Solirubrobacterales bacterium]|nr:rhomboid family intrarane serine protease [Solirubrobacterales bacterium]